MAWYLLTLRPRLVSFLGPGKLPLLIDDSVPGVSSRNVMPALLNCAIACEVVIGASSVASVADALNPTGGSSSQKNFAGPELGEQICQPSLVIFTNAR